MNYFNTLCITGYDLEKEIPEEAIKDCSSQGAVDNMVRYWVDKIDFDAEPEKARLYLKSMGAWDDEQLVDHDMNIQRLFWLVCCDIEEERAQQE